MKFFVGIKLFFCCIYLVAAINGTKKKRKSIGLTFRKSEYTQSFCSSLGCKDGRGYTSSNEGECYSVNRCTKCKTTNKSESSMAYCSVIPTILNEITIFQGYLKISKNGLEILKSGMFANGDSYISEDDESKTDESENSQEEDEDDEEDDKEEVIHKSDTNFPAKKSISTSVSSSFSGSVGYSLLQLVSQMSESEFEEGNESNNITTKSNKSRSKSLLSRVFGKKKKNLPDTNQATQFKKTNKFSFSLNNFKNKFRNKNGLVKFNSPTKGIKKNEINPQEKMNSAHISKGTTIELEATGRVLTERLNTCTVIDGYVPLTVHTFLQYYNIKKLSKVRPKKYKYAAFEFMVDSSCDFDELCRKPSNFIGRLTPRQKLVMSNSISIPVGLFKKNGISQVIKSIRTKYICKGPKCFPEQYNSCVKITCALNKADLHDQEWRKIQTENTEEREREVEKAVSNELQNFREFVADENNSLNNEKSTETYSKTMNGPLSFTDAIQNPTIENAAYKIENSKDLVESEQNDQNVKLNNFQDKNETITVETRSEEEIIDAPSDGKRSSGLMERLKRSLGVSAEEEAASNEHEENDSEDSLQEKNEEIPFQPEITISNEIEKSKSNIKNVIYATLGITCTILIIIGVVCIV
ncbi:uncharacterized protein cubi_01852 [Cryptosporidium ubiquitum]|uniref:Uncharacterized protein n=1 Tax=Cryptosporidium ubiquitum TaxID=857276 RepID=A0A1J4MPF1_9CRYT|nr:uncharacterized protein cubi_01852 [Cryptosporidium ubiquitum]OII75331.1 hypothetical protein cubi_01852 [Cryptosporidium ubiquitum]